MRGRGDHLAPHGPFLWLMLHYRRPLGLCAVDLAELGPASETCNLRPRAQRPASTQASISFESSCLKLDTVRETIPHLGPSKRRPPFSSPIREPELLIRRFLLVLSPALGTAFATTLLAIPVHSSLPPSHDACASSARVSRSPSSSNVFAELTGASGSLKTASTSQLSPAPSPSSPCASSAPRISSTSSSRIATTPVDTSASTTMSLV